ncbi:glycosyltransferase family 61 protein [Halorubrum ezzemoulense]|uniref:glycosyltransferase family 61 protein n=1 Tax=Halorubrum TaxID=56688 RepID=UPI0010F65D67|nr:MULTISPECIES: glycosyltransferase family 61 protein [Halorubrum]MDB2253414.1 glycosyltransferase family 61 protein [Halorubrum ezzemoulense]TKX63971.1 glycosyltransferase family 61 protein [Halorubrum sp. GN12_10-3_MGM]
MSRIKMNPLKSIKKRITRAAWESYINMYSITIGKCNEKEKRDICEYTTYEKDEPGYYCNIPNSKYFPEDFMRFAGYHKPEPRYMCCISPCQIVGALATPIVQNKIVLDSFGGTATKFTSIKTTTQKKEYFENNYTVLDYIFNRLEVDRPVHPSNQIFPLVHYYKSYFHWITEYLPKLRVLDKYERQTGNKPDILIRSNPESFRLETLEMLGYSKDRLVTWDNTDYNVDNLIITNHRAQPTNQSLRDYLWLQREVSQSISDRPNIETHNRIFVSRQKTNRRIENYGEFTSLLDRYDFEPHVLEDLKFEEQVQLFDNVDIVLGPHGAGLTNLIFSDDPCVIELIPDNHVDPGFYLLTECLDLDYYPYMTSTNKNGNLIIDIEALSDYLDNIM